MPSVNSNRGISVLLCRGKAEPISCKDVTVASERCLALRGDCIRRRCTSIPGSELGMLLPLLSSTTNRGHRMYQTEASGELATVQRAMPETRSHPDGDWTTGFYKEPVSGPVYVTVMGLEGDGVADKKHHGGIDKAVLAYSADNYPLWENELSQPMEHGGFGENLTINGLDESSVCIGDRFRIGEVIFEVSQPRQPCWKLGRRWNHPELPKLVVQNSRSGWYLRVLEEGTLKATDSVDLELRPNPAWTIRQANEVFYRGSVQQKRELVALRQLADAWK